jgi:hypothetical protein
LDQFLERHWFTKGESRYNGNNQVQPVGSVEVGKRGL